MIKILLVSFILIFNVSFAKEYSLNGPVNDYSGILSKEVKDNLDKKLMEEYKKSGTQVAVLIIDTLDGDSIENFSIKMVEKYPLGQKGKDNGVLFTLVLKDRKMRIEVGRGLEGSLTDLASKRILGKAKPQFKQQNFSEGTLIVVNEILETIQTDLVKPQLTQEELKKQEQIREEMHKQAFLLVMTVMGIGLVSLYLIVSLVQIFSLLKDIKKYNEEYLYFSKVNKTIKDHQTHINNLFEKRLQYEKIFEKLNDLKIIGLKFNKEKDRLINTESDLEVKSISLDQKIEALQKEDYKKNPTSMLSNFPDGISNREKDIAKWMTK